MLTARSIAPAILIAAALALSGCAADNPFGTGPATTQALPAKPKVDPACVALASRIDALRKEGAADRVAEVAKGKSATVTVKRASLAKVAELDKANAEFQAKCSTVAQPAAAPAPATTAATPPAAPAKAAPVVAKAAPVVAKAAPKQ